jgi:hypothetical protein
MWEGVGGGVRGVWIGERFRDKSNTVCQTRLPSTLAPVCARLQVYDVDDDGVVDEEDFRRMYIGGIGVKDDVHIEEVRL